MEETAETAETGVSALAVVVWVVSALAVAVWVVSALAVEESG